MPHISWTKLGDSSKVFPPGQKLVLQNVSRHDKGTYVCEAKNGLGLPDTATTVLNVLREYTNLLHTGLTSKTDRT